MNGLEETKKSIISYIENKKNPYLTPVEIEQNRWLAGASHCTIRELMREGKLPSIKVGTAFRAHYKDIIEFLEKSYINKKV